MTTDTIDRSTATVTPSHEAIMLVMRSVFATAVKEATTRDGHDKALAELASSILDQAARADEERRHWSMEELKSTEALTLLDMLPVPSKKYEGHDIVYRPAFRVLRRHLFCVWTNTTDIEVETKFADALLAQKTESYDSEWSADVREGMKFALSTAKLYRLLARATNESDPTVVEIAFKSIARCEGGRRDMLMAGKFFQSLRGEHTREDVGQLALDYAEALGIMARSMSSMKFPCAPLRLSYKCLLSKVHDPKRIEYVWRFALDELPKKKVESALQGWLDNIEQYVAEWRGKHPNIPRFSLDLSIEIVYHHYRYHEEDHQPVLKTLKKHID